MSKQSTQQRQTRTLRKDADTARCEATGAWWCREEDPSGDYVCHLGPKTLIKASHGQVGVQVEQTTGPDEDMADAHPFVYLAQDHTADGVGLTPQEAIQVGAALIRAGEEALYPDGSEWPGSPRDTESVREAAKSIAPILARIPDDALFDAIEEEAEEQLGGGLSALLSEAGLNVERGIGCRINYYVDGIARPAERAMAAAAAVRYVNGQPDYTDAWSRMWTWAGMSRELLDAEVELKRVRTMRRG